MENEGQMEVNEPHLRLERLDCPGRRSRNQQYECNVMVGEIWIEFRRTLELGNGRFVLPHETQCPAEREVRARQIGGQPYRLASRLIGAVDGRSPWTTIVPSVNAQLDITLGKEGMGPGVVGVDGQRLLQA